MLSPDTGTLLETFGWLETGFFLRFEMGFLWGKKDKGPLEDEFQVRMISGEWM